MKITYKNNDFELMSTIDRNDNNKMYDIVVVFRIKYLDDDENEISKEQFDKYVDDENHCYLTDYEYVTYVYGDTNDDEMIENVKNQIDYYYFNK